MSNTKVNKLIKRGKRKVKETATII